MTNPSASGRRRRRRSSLRGSAASASAPRISSSAAAASRRAADAERDVGLAGVGAHRREVRQRARERAVADSAGVTQSRRKCVVSTIVSVETTARTAAGPHDRGVVPDPALDALAPRARDRGDRLDQGALVQWAQRWR